MNRSACGRMRVLYTIEHHFALQHPLHVFINLDWWHSRQALFAVTLLCCLADSFWFGVGTQLVCESVIWPVKVYGGSIWCLLISARSEVTPHWIRSIDLVTCKHAQLRGFIWFQHTLTPLLFTHRSIQVLPVLSIDLSPFWNSFVSPYPLTSIPCVLLFRV